MLKRNKTEGPHTADIDEAQLLAYIEGSLSPEEQFRLETLLEQDPFLNDAVEGLAEVKDKAQLKAITQQLNAQLRKQIRSRRNQRRRRPQTTHHWGWIFVLAVLLLIILSWLVMRALPAR